MTLNHPFFKALSLHQKQIKVALFCTALFLFLTSFEQSSFAQVLSLNFGKGNESLSGQVVNLMLLLTILSLAPSILIMVTSFTRIIVVLSFLRSALGLQQSPPNTVLISLALFLTGYIMSPVFTESYDQGIQHLISGDMETMEGIDAAAGPFKKFMLKNVREKDLLLFLDIGDHPKPENIETVPIQSLIPAFIISELRRAFEIGFMLFLPFLIIDIVVASVLMSMGMMMVPPVMISLPFKIIFFVLVDGWYLVAGSLSQSYQPF